MRHDICGQHVWLPQYVMRLAWRNRLYAVVVAKDQPLLGKQLQPKSCQLCTFNVTKRLHIKADRDCPYVNRLATLNVA